MRIYSRYFWFLSLRPCSLTFTFLREICTISWRISVYFRFPALAEEVFYITSLLAPSLLNGYTLSYNSFLHHCLILDFHIAINFSWSFAFSRNWLRTALILSPSGVNYLVCRTWYDSFRYFNNVRQSSSTVIFRVRQACFSSYSWVISSSHRSYLNSTLDAAFPQLFAPIATLPCRNSKSRLLAEARWITILVNVVLFIFTKMKWSNYQRQQCNFKSLLQDR